MNQNPKTQFIVTFVCFLSCFSFTAPSRAATLVDKGAARAVVVLPEKATPVVEQAAKLLRDHIKQMSGIELPMRREDQVTGEPSAKVAWLLVGESKLAAKHGWTAKDLGAGGILLVSKGNVVAVLGHDSDPRDPAGTRYAVTTFLEEKLGVRYLWPGELGKVVPKKETITVADFEHRFTPVLGQRRIRSLEYHDRVQVGLDRLGFSKDDYVRRRSEAQRTVTAPADWFGWQRLGGTLNLQGGHAFGHMWAKYGKEHPDWFALQPNGSRDQSSGPDRSQLCTSNSELIAAIAREKIEELNRNPNLLSVSVGPNDGGRPTFCTCPKCEALDAAKGRKIQLWDFSKAPGRFFDHVSLTDRMVVFWSAIAEQVVKVHPDKFLVVDAYSVYAAPPVTRKLHPNLVVRFASLGYGDEDYRRESMADWNAWSKAAQRIYFRPNLMLAGRRDGMPLIYVHKFGEDFRYLAHHSMMGTDFDSCTHNWATQGLNYYVVARLHWNPDQPVDTIVDDYCKSGFGPAAASVRRYFDLLEARMNEIALKKVKPYVVFDAETKAALQKDMDDARQAARDDVTITKRIEFLELGLRWTLLETRAHALLADAAKADKKAAKQLLDERFALMQEIFQKAPLAVNVAYVSWGEDAGWAALGWQAPKMNRKP